MFLFKTFSCIRFKTLNQLKFYVSFYLRGKSRRGDGSHVLRAQVFKGSGEVIRASAPYTSG